MIPKNPAHARRLDRLADFLDKLPPEKFDLTNWVKGDGDKWTPECGTAACACGWAGTIPEFKEEGFSLCRGTPVYVDANENAHDGWDAVDEFFGLNSEDAYYLFSVDSYPASYRLPKDVAARIRDYLNVTTIAR